MTTILGIDPGEATGWSLWEYGKNTAARRLEYGLVLRGVEGFMEFTYAMPMRIADEIVFEEFKLDGRTKSPDLVSREIQGCARMWTYGREVPLHLQDNGFKRQVNDQVLKDAGLWVMPADVGYHKGRDVNDSQVHVLARLKTQGHLPTLARYWPDE